MVKTATHAFLVLDNVLVLRSQMYVSLRQGMTLFLDTRCCTRGKLTILAELNLQWEQLCSDVDLRRHCFEQA